MANEIVPQDDLPDEIVPEHDLPDQPGTYDPRSLVPKAIGAGAGAVLGPVASAVAKSGVKQVQQGRVSPPPSISVPHPSEVTPGHTPYKATGVSVEDSVSNWKSYNEAQLEAAKKVRQESALHKKYPGFTRAGPQLEIPQLPANATWAQKAGSKMWPSAASDVANFAKGVSEYKLPLIGQVGPLVGHLVGGAATGAQGVDAYNRGIVQDDTTGGVISGIGAVGTGISTLPFPPVVRGIGAGVGLSAEAINAYRDAMREGRIEHGAPEHPENTTSIGDTYAQGGLVHLAGGGQPNINFSANTMPSMSGQPGVGYMQMPQAAMGRMQLEQELANQARLRAGATGMSMAIPGQQGIKLMPGNIEAGVNIPVGQGNVDISGYRSINPVNMPAQRGGHMQGANVRYTLPFAEGGQIEGGFDASIPVNSPEYEEAARKARENAYLRKAIEEGKEINANRNKYEPNKGSDKPVTTSRVGGGGAGFVPGSRNPFNPDSPLNR